MGLAYATTATKLVHVDRWQTGAKSFTTVAMPNRDAGTIAVYPSFSSCFSRSMHYN